MPRTIPQPQPPHGTPGPDENVATGPAEHALRALSAVLWEVTGNRALPRSAPGAEPAGTTAAEASAREAG